jgi:glycosyltransferase involved in cell wall biosynthesis
MTPKEVEKDSAPAVYPRVRRGVVMTQWAGIAVLAAAPILESPWLRWIACSVLGVQALGNLSLGALFRANLRGLPNLVTPPQINDDPFLGVSIIVPARNEETTIERGLRSLLALDYPQFEVIAINDGSTDNTPNILDEIAAADSRLRVIYNPPLPDGWQGKANAVWHGVQTASSTHPWLLLTDADALFKPETLRRAMAIVATEKLDFLTGIVYLDNQSVWEELLMPAAWSGFVINARPGRLNDSDAPPIGAGPFMLLKRDVYLRSGGHSRIRNRQPEDTHLAAVVKAAGARVGVVVATSMVRVRIYAGFSTMARALIRKMRIQNRQQPGFLELRLTYTLLQEVFPLLVFAGSCGAMTLGGTRDLSWICLGVAALSAYASFALTLGSFRTIARMRPMLAWLHPVAGIVRAGLTLRAWIAERQGAPLTWRGRLIDET